MKYGFLPIIFLCTVISCHEGSSVTAVNYKNRQTIDPNLYRKDSIEIHRVLKKMLSQHVHPFVPAKLFDTTTRIYVDSIIYSPNRLKMIAFVITRNSTTKLLKKENNEPYFYNANYLYCSRQNKEMPIKIYDYVGFNLVYYYSYESVKQRLQEYCFSDLANENKFNVDDLRFWYSEDFHWVMNNSLSVSK